MCLLSAAKRVETLTYVGNTLNKVWTFRLPPPTPNKCCSDVGITLVFFSYNHTESGRGRVDVTIFCSTIENKGISDISGRFCLNQFAADCIAISL